MLILRFIYANNFYYVINNIINVSRNYSVFIRVNNLIIYSSN